MKDATQAKQSKKWGNLTAKVRALQLEAQTSHERYDEEMSLMRSKNDEEMALMRSQPNNWQRQPPQELAEAANLQ
jgi:hypothetical protein